LTQARVEKVVFEGKTAVGISMTSLLDGEIAIARARKEVVMAAGPVFSVNLLHKSGIGPRDMLDNAGIEIVQDLPGVGSNFQDHPTAYMTWNLTEDTFPRPELLMTNVSFFAEAEDEYYTNRTGPLIQAHGNDAAFLSLHTISASAAEIVAAIEAQNTSQYLPSTYDPTSAKGYAAQHAILVSRFNSTKSAMYEMTFNGGKSVVNAFQKPLSRGTISLNMSDPALGPLVDYNTLANPIDGLLTVAMLNYTRRYFETSSMATLGAVEVVPGASYASTDQILEVFKGGVLAPSFSHPSCANPMMPLELGGVVSPELLVYGVERLSVVDSSIMPMIPATHLCGTVYAIAEKAADLIKERHRAGSCNER
jgi:choline dehydrogenase-like flavoprotein